MTAEDDLVYRLAFELKKTPEEIQDGCTTVDLIRLGQKLNDRWNEHTKEDWYAAQLAYEVFATPFRVWGKKVPTEFTVKTFLMTFKVPERQPDQEELDEETKKRNAASYVELQKAYWFAAVGLDPNDPAGKNDGIPVQTRLPPDMTGMTRDSAVNDAVGVTPAGPRASEPVRAGSVTNPRGRKGRMNGPRPPKGT